MAEATFDPTAPCAAILEASAAAARARQAQLLKPPGSLGRLEDVAVTLAGVQGDADYFSAEQASIILFAGDHGVTAQGVSPYPSAVTTMMLEQFAGGRAAISILAERLGAGLEIVDVGVATDRRIERVVIDKLRGGTLDFTIDAAMTAEETVFAVAAGARAVERTAAASDGRNRICVFGDMGIGNTTSASAVLAALTGASAAAVTGPGTGLDAAGVEHKAGVIARGLDRHGLMAGHDKTPDTVLAAVGGFEIAAIAGGMIACGQRREAVLVDGFIATVAALVAVKINAGVRPFLIFGHRSAEPGHRIALEALSAQPLLDLGMRLGEGSGAAAALPLVRLACDLHHGMATFEDVGMAGPGPA